MIKKTLALGTAIATAAVGSVLVFGNVASAHETKFVAKLKDPNGTVVGTVKFSVGHHAMDVEARLRPNPLVAANQFHGFHIHANNITTNGNGCQADPDDLQASWFMSADGHLSEVGEAHGAHAGDMPSPLVLADGTAYLAFRTDRIEPDTLRRTAVILHKDRDNFGNVPIGPAANQYTDNGTAQAATDATGNAGPRMACGLVRRAVWQY